MKGGKLEEGGKVARGVEKAAADSALWSSTLPTASASQPAKEGLPLF